MRSVITALMLGGALAFTGCGQNKAADSSEITSASSARQIGAAYIAEMGRIADALETVKDEQSARAAAAEIRTAADRLEAMGDALEGREATPMLAMQMFGTRGEEFASVQMRITTSLMTLQAQHPELMAIVSTEMDRLDH